jgi:DNA-binding response OmpR family regulator
VVGFRLFSIHSPGTRTGDELPKPSYDPPAKVRQAGVELVSSGERRRSVFLVEDEVMIRMMVSDMLEELGYQVVAEAGDIDEAVRLVQCTNFDIAILDVNVNGKVISPVAEAVQMRNRPFVFATGYGVQGLPEKFRDRPALQKPFQMETLAKMIEVTLRGEAA